MVFCCKVRNLINYTTISIHKMLWSSIGNYCNSIQNKKEVQYIVYWLIKNSYGS